mgnify:CR=1 FL=1
MKRKTLVTAVIATVALLTLLLAFPLFVAPTQSIATSLPATAANIQTTNNNPSEKQIEALDSWESWLIPIGFNFTNNASGVFTNPWLPNTKFGLGFAKLVEFNDSNDDGFYNFNESDQIIKEYDLVQDVYWNRFTFSIDWPSGQMFPSGIILNLTGQEKDVINFTISLVASLYIVPKTITFNNTNITIPASISLKFGLYILGYNWEDESSSYPYGSRYLALVISLNSSVGGSASYNFMLSNGTVLSADISGVVPSLSGTDGNVCEVFIVDAFGIARAKFSWFNGAYNTSAEVTTGQANSYFNKTGNTTNISMAFAHDDFTTGDIILDPYFQLIPPDYMSLFLTIIVLASLATGFAGQAMSRLLLYGGIAALAVIGIIVVAVIAARRR